MDVSLAVKLMLYGLIGVFTVLVVFYAILRLLPMVLPDRGDRAAGGQPEDGQEKKLGG
jgi:hypothetical protein